MASLSGNQLDQRGKKFAIRSMVQVVPLPPIFSLYRIGENWCRFQISKGLRLHTAEAKVSLTLVCADSINTPLLGKKKFLSAKCHSEPRRRRGISQGPEARLSFVRSFAALR